ncbi:MAG: alginate lyase family protein [Bacteroidota bacterium]
MKANTLKWYINRLSAMSLSEFLWRLGFVLKKKLWKLKKNHTAPIPIFKRLQEKQIGILLESVEQDKILIEADKYMQHQWLFFGLSDCFEPEIDWHCDPESKVKAPHKFGFDINHRNEDLVGNIKNTWEKNRHHHLTILAVAFQLTKNEKYAAEIDKQLKSWVQNNAYLVGVNWTHPLEQGIRLISWVYLYRLLKESKYFDDIFGDEGYLWDSIYFHQRFIENTFSRGSSANNHLIGEMAGLYIASVVWPFYKKSERWRKKALTVLNKEVCRQNYKDGINKELGFSYQSFVIQFGLLSLFECSDDFDEAYKATLYKMITFHRGITDVLGFIPNYGDGDEGIVLQLNVFESKQLPWLNKLADYIFLSETGDKHFSVDDIVSEEAGIIALERKVNNLKVALYFDFGPLGMGKMAAHGHADALSFMLAVDEKEFFVDTGTYSYHNDLRWREYFRSTRAHNTLLVESEDQSDQQGPFLWGDHAHAELLNFQPDPLCMEAFHTGYEKYGVKHIRKILLEDTQLIIIDKLEGANKKQVQIRFHLHPEVSVSQQKNELYLKRNDNILTMIYPESMECTLLKGENEGGWYSPCFGIKVPTVTIVLNQILSLPSEIKTVIKIK